MLTLLTVSGCFLEASHLVDQLSFDMLCGAKSRSILGTSVNVMDREETSLLLQDVEHVAKLRVLQKQCRGYYELSLLVKAVDALNVWRRVEHDYATLVSMNSLTINHILTAALARSRGPAPYLQRSRQPLRTHVLLLSPS